MKSMIVENPLTFSRMDIKTIKHIASLARIRLAKVEEDKMKEELSSILGYIEKLNQIDTGAIEPLYQTTGLVNSMRGDSVGGGNDKYPGERLVAQAPSEENGFVKVKSVLNK